MDIAHSSKIQLLPEHIIDQIKAGEVIERPSTLLKELLENSIDAGSTEISLHIIDNGLELIQIKDNGSGINATDLPLAFCRHATSKIIRFEDIYKLHSYGFRGEALASIASISKIKCETNTESSTGKISIEGGETKIHSSQEVLNNKTGTSFYIKDLFYNTPVRMKFIQSKTSEKNQLKKIINAFLLTHPQVSFSIKWDDLDRDFYPEKDEKIDRISDALFRNKSINLFQVQNAYDGIEFNIYLSHESTRGNAHKSHYIFINDRVVQDIQIHKIILNSASHIWPEGETGHYVAYLNISPDEIDVNIHPNKTVVKLFKPAQVFSLISGAIKHYITKKPSLSEITQPHSPQTQLLANEKDISKSVKNIDYKQVNFTDSASVNSYLSNIHTNSTQSPPPTTKIKINEFEFFEINHKIYLLSIERLLHFELEYLLSQTQEDIESIPLLVSRPISVDKIVPESVIELINQYGFEIDQLDEKTIIVRSFPKKLQKLPYLKIVNAILNQVKNIDFSDLELWQDHSYHISELIDKFGMSKLIQNKIVIELHAKDIKKLYEKK